MKMESRSKEIKKQMDSLKRSLNELSTEYDILRREIRRRRDVKFVPTERRVFTMPAVLPTVADSLMKSLSVVSVLCLPVVIVYNLSVSARQIHHMCAILI